MSPSTEPVYCFVAIDFAGRSVQMEIRQHDGAAREHYKGIWNKLSQAVQKQHQLADALPAPGWTTWKPWEWCDIPRGYERRQQYVAWCGNHLVGFLNVWPDVPAVHQPGKNLLYVEHMAAAPGNLTTELWCRRFRFVGASLLAYAILLSKEQGFEGRIGLHAAEETALTFYRHLNTAKCSGGLFHPERSDVPGPTPRGEQERARTYLETTEVGAIGWLEGYRSA